MTDINLKDILVNNRIDELEALAGQIDINDTILFSDAEIYGSGSSFCSADYENTFRETTPLNYAIRKEKIDLAKTILKPQFNCDVNKPNPGDNSTPLVNAGLFGQKEIVQLLLEHHADTSIGDDDDETALISIIKETVCGDPEIIKMIAEAGGKELLQKTDKEGMSALYYAIKVDTCESDIVRVLVEAGCDPNARTYIKNHMTPLQFVGYDYDAYPEKIKELIECGADVNATDDEGDTALIKFLRQGSEYVEALLDASPNVDVNKRNRDGLTPLKIAMDIGHRGGIIQLLRQRGAVLD